MKTFIILICFVCAARVALADTWHPQRELLDAVCQIESSGGKNVYGDDGLSLGHFQIQKGAWADVVAWRRQQNLPTHDYRKHVFDPKISRLYAAGYLTILHGRLRQHYRREPTVGELYAAYNMGMTNFRKCNYSLSQVNRTTASKCRQLTAMVDVAKRMSNHQIQIAKQ